MLRVVGDVHGHVRGYEKILDGACFSVQLGDMGFKEEYVYLDLHLDPARHVFIPGNHDDYDHLPLHALRDFGMCSLGGVEFFHIRGAYSVDHMRRVQGVSWWANEELSIRDANHAIDLFERAKPEIVLSHDCPTEVLSYFTTNPYKEDEPSRTNKILSAMLECHTPKLWVFGHHHQTKTMEWNGTVFKCLAELDAINIKPGGHIQ